MIIDSRPVLVTSFDSNADSDFGSSYGSGASFGSGADSTLAQNLILD